jgi:hypothetical protein
MLKYFLLLSLFSAKSSFSQQNIYDSLAHKFYVLNEDSNFTYQIMKNDLDKLIISSKKSYYSGKMQEINLFTNFLEDLIDLKDSQRVNLYGFIYGGFGHYLDSLMEQQVLESKEYSKTVARQISY